MTHLKLIYDKFRSIWDTSVTQPLTHMWFISEPSVTQLRPIYDSSVSNLEPISDKSAIYITHPWHICNPFVTRMRPIRKHSWPILWQTCDLRKPICDQSVTNIWSIRDLSMIHLWPITWLIRELSETHLWPTLDLTTNLLLIWDTLIPWLICKLPVTLRPYKPGPVILRQFGQCGGPFVYHICTWRKTSFTKFVISLLTTKYYQRSVVPSYSVVHVWSQWRKQRKRIITFEKMLKLSGET